MDASYITPFIESVDNVFSTMLQMHVEVEKPSLKAPGQPRFDVSGIIGLSGDVTGAVVVSFPSDTAERIVSLFTGMQLTTTDEDFADAIGELVNMITGNAKAKFVDRAVSISCPSVIIGQGHQVFQQKDAPLIEIPCTCDCGQFVVDITMRETTKKAAPKAAQAVAGV